MLDISAMYLSDPQQVTATNPAGESLTTKLTRWRSVPGSEILITIMFLLFSIQHYYINISPINKNDTSTMYSVGEVNIGQWHY